MAYQHARWKHVSWRGYLGILGVLGFFYSLNHVAPPPAPDYLIPLVVCYPASIVLGFWEIHRLKAIERTLNAKVRKP